MVQKVEISANERNPQKTSEEFKQAVRDLETGGLIKVSGFTDEIEVRFFNFLASDVIYSLMLPYKMRAEYDDISLIYVCRRLS